MKSEKDEDRMSVLAELLPEGAAGSLILDLPARNRKIVASTRIVFTYSPKEGAYKTAFSFGST